MLEPSKYYSIADVVKILGASTTTVRRLILEGELRAYKIRGHYKIDPKDVEKYLQSTIVRPDKGNELSTNDNEEMSNITNEEDDN